MDSGNQSAVSEHTSEGTNSKSSSDTNSPTRSPPKIDSVKSSNVKDLTKMFLKKSNQANESKILSIVETSLVNSFSKSLARNIHNTIENVESHI